MQEIFFPYDEIRNEQEELIADILNSLKAKKHILVHAPTGLGKTIASLGPALKYAQDNNLKIFFVTPRHTQHTIAIETVKAINKKFNINISVVDFLGKKHMCAHEGVSSLYSNQFFDFCKKQVEENLCEFYSNTRKKDGKSTVFAQNIISDLQMRGPNGSEIIIEHCKGNKVCPYEISGFLAQNSRLIIADYFHVLHPKIREAFFKRCNANLENSIIIIDEAHNLPSRVRDLMTVSISGFVLNAARKEAEKYDQDLLEIVNFIEKIFIEIKERMKGKSEIKIKREDIVDRIEKTYDYNALIAQLSFAAEATKKEKKSSSLGSIAEFLSQWQGDDFGFVRIANHDGKKLTISYRCLDPSLITSDFIKSTYCTIAMSGTLSPVTMYHDLLGFPENSFMHEYKNPFPHENRLNLIIPQTSTKYVQRSDEMFKKISDIVSEIVNTVPGNSAVFFPSYQIRNAVNFYFQSKCNKTTFLEDSSMTKSEREEMIESFKQYKELGAVLLGTVAGSFSEGIDLPGDLLKCVIVVGIPLGKPDLETEELISYYDKKFGKGWNYGYMMPAMTRVIQSAGRCIRTENDRGVIVFLDERFTWKNYYDLFPKDWDIKITGLYEKRVREFFGS